MLLDDILQAATAEKPCDAPC